MTTYIVFQDGLSGLKHIVQMDAYTLQEAVQNIQEGCVGYISPSQHYMYFIYANHQANIPLNGTRYDSYKYIKAVPGSYVEASVRNKQGLGYALKHNSSMAWFFSDDIFGDY